MENILVSEPIELSNPGDYSSYVQFYIPPILPGNVSIDLAQVASKSLDGMYVYNKSTKFRKTHSYTYTHIDLVLWTDLRAFFNAAVSGTGKKFGWFDHLSVFHVVRFGQVDLQREKILPRMWQVPVLLLEEL